jgi:hypothetical protein
MFLRHPYNRQPQGAFKANRNHPLLRGCKALWCFNENGLQVIDRLGVYHGTWTIKSGNSPGEWQLLDYPDAPTPVDWHDGTARTRYRYKDPPGANNAGLAGSGPTLDREIGRNTGEEATFVGHYFIRNDSGASLMGNKTHATAGQNEIDSASSKQHIFIEEEANGFERMDNVFPPTGHVAGQTQQLVVLFGADDNPTVYSNDVFREAEVGAKIGLIQFDAFGQTGTGSDVADWNAFICIWAGWWDRLLSPAEIHQLNKNPWVVYSRPMPVWIQAGAAPPAAYQGISVVGLPV